MKTFAALVLVILSLVLPAAAEPEKSCRVAIVTVDQVVQRVGYETIGLLGAAPDVRAAVKSIREDLARLNGRLLETTETSEIESISKSIEALERKRNILVQQSRNPDQRRVVRQFVVAQFKDKYALILSRAESQGDGVLYLEGQGQDITEEVIDLILANE